MSKKPVRRHMTRNRALREGRNNQKRYELIGLGLT